MKGSEKLKQPIKKIKKKTKDIFLLERRKFKRFGTKVNIVKRKRKEIEIEYYNDEDLDRRVNLLEDILFL